MIFSATDRPSTSRARRGATSLTAALGDSPAALPQTYEKAWDVKSGAVLSGFPRLQDGFPFYVAPLVAGLDSSQQRAVIDSNDSGWIHAYEPAGGEAPGFPKFTGQWPSFSGVVGDPRFDGNLRLGLRDPRGRPVRLAREGRSRPQRFLVALPPRRAQQRPVRQRHAASRGAHRDPNHAGRRRRHPPLDCAGR